MRALCNGPMHFSSTVVLHAGYVQALVDLSVRVSVRHTLVLYQNEQSYMSITVTS